MIAKDLCEKIGIQEENHINCAYMDLLLQKIIEHKQTLRSEILFSSRKNKSIIIELERKFCVE